MYTKSDLSQNDVNVSQFSIKVKGDAKYMLPSAVLKYEPLIQTTEDFIVWCNEDLSNKKMLKVCSALFIYVYRWYLQIVQTRTGGTY